MLIIKRKANEFITIEPAEGADRSLTIEDLFTDGCIEIRLLEVGSKQIKLAIEAPPQLKIWRDEGPVAPSTKVAGRRRPNALEKTSVGRRS